MTRRRQLVCLCLPDERLTSDQAVVRRKHAVAFYTDLFRAESCDVEAAAELLQDLPQVRRSTTS